MVRSAAAAVLTWAAFAHPVSSAPDCGGPQIEMTECANDRAETSRKAMDAAYGELAKRIGPGTRRRLEAAQRAWAGYLEAECELIAYGDGGGSVAPMYRANCLQELMDQRTKYLRQSMDCSDRDPHCIEEFEDGMAP